MANRASFTLILIFILSIFSCQKETPPIKIGFAGNFTGKNASISINARNGALLAVDDINADGGINGRHVELIVKDDRLEPEMAIKVIQELIRKNVVAIVGHVNSTMCQAVLPVAAREKIVLISPVAPASQLTGTDDYLFRIPTPPVKTNEMTAEYAYHNGLKKMAGLYDLANRSYTEKKFMGFKTLFESTGGKISAHTFTSGTGTSFPELVNTLVQSDPDGYFIIASATDTAMICQHLRKFDPSGTILTTGWACEPELLNNGGAAVEGVVLVNSFQSDNKNPAFLQFKEIFFSRYHTPPIIWDTYGYEAVMVIAQAIARNANPDMLKETMLKIGRFKGLQGNILFDRFGDNLRPPKILTVKNGAFIEINQSRKNPN